MGDTIVDLFRWAVSITTRYRMLNRWEQLMYYRLHGGCVTKLHCDEYHKYCRITRRIGIYARTTRTIQFNSEGQERDQDFVINIHIG